MLKYLLLVALCAASCTPAEQKAEPAEQTACVKQISITHIGIQDKPVGGLILTTSAPRQADAADMYTSVVVVSEDEFTRVAQLLKTFDPSTHQQFLKGHPAESGTFWAIVVDDCKQASNISHLPGRAEALFRLLLDNIEYFEPKNREVVEQKLNRFLGVC